MFRNVTMDCQDLDRLAQFWQAAVGFTCTENDGTWATLVDPDQPRPRLLLQRVPEGKQMQKNRLHLDLGARDMDAEVERLVDLGARVLGRVHEGDDLFIVLTDPEGNEFCVVRET